MEICQDDHAPVVEEIDPFPNAAPRRRGAKSFSSLKHPVDGLVALGRRLSVSIRNKPSKQTTLAEHVKLVDDDEDRYYHHVSSHANHKRMASGSWDVRSTKPYWHQGYSVNRRPSLNSVSALHSFYAPTASIPAPIPGRGQAPPVLPNHKSAGAAARAAAAAQNEQMEAARMAKVELENKMLDLRVPQDSESGICIDLRDRSDVSDTDLLAIMRLGKDEPPDGQRACFANFLVCFFRSRGSPSGRDYITYSVIFGPRFSHERGARVSHLVRCVLFSCLEARIPQCIWPTASKRDSLQVEAIIWLREVNPAPGLEEEVPCSARSRSALGGWQSCSHLSSRSRGQRLLLSI